MAINAIENKYFMIQSIYWLLDRKLTVEIELDVMDITILQLLP